MLSIVRHTGGGFVSPRKSLRDIEATGHSNSGSHQSVVQGICNSRRDKELIADEQFLNILPADIQVWFRERKPKTTAKADQ